MKKRNFLSCLLIIAVVLATISPTVLFAAEDIAQDEQVYDETYTEETEEYVEETPEAYDWTIETNELKKWPQGPRVEAEGATVMDLDTGAFLYSKNAEAKLYPASITKIMTMLVALEHISDSDLDTKVKASESALAPIDSDSSQIWLSRRGENHSPFCPVCDHAGICKRCGKCDRRVRRRIDGQFCEDDE